VASCDIYRPAAIEQLKTLANDLNINFFPSDVTQKPVDIANNAIKEARKTFIDVVIIDTAGRLHVDEDMMSEIKQIAHSIKPHETLFVVDSMTGQDAANTAKAFNEALPLTGIVLTKTDGDARLGAALSIHHITQKPIKFLGTGEKTDALELFDPKRVASRILGMGDIVGLVEHAQEKINAKEAEKFAKKMVSGGQFTLDDFAAQLEQMAKMGDLQSLLSKVPGMGQMVEAAKHKIPEAEKSLKKNLALIRSMTPNERTFPAKITNQPSRKRRIVNGAGLQPQDLSALLKQFEKMRDTMKKMKGGGMMKMMQKMQGMMGNGGFPPMG
jgi:signal recognition particle subunit SRP54